MSSTRKSKDSSKLRQDRYASSPEFERGLLANLVAKRCELIESAEDRELVWFVQHLSHLDGGLAAVAQSFNRKYSAQLQTAAMVKIGLKEGKICNAEQVKAIRAEMPLGERTQFLLKGESSILSVLSNDASDKPYSKQIARAYHACIDLDGALNSESNPMSYPAKLFLDLCRSEAECGLEKYLYELCLNPALTVRQGPWYFPTLIDALRDLKNKFAIEKAASIAVTALVEKVNEVLDYTFYSRGLTLMQGEARTGKSTAARVWCAQRPGVARFVEVPSSNDECSFFRALARGLGLGNFLNYKMGEIRDRVESVLLSGSLLLVLDEAQRLWPQKNYRYGFPNRIIWVMTMANAGVPIAMISTPQFIQTQQAIEKAGWNSAQLTGRISHYEPLPVDLSAEDLMAVAKSVLPESDTQVLRALAVYARSSARYLAAIDSISKRARYLAMRAGRAIATADDVRRAMQESVIPADTKLQLALSAGKKSKAAPIAQLPAPTLPAEPQRMISDNDCGKVSSARRSSNANGLGALPGQRRNQDFKAPLIEA